MDDSQRNSSLVSRQVLSQDEVDDVADLFGQMLKYDPGERADIETVLQHERFTKTYDS